MIAAQTGTNASKIQLKKWYNIFKDHIMLQDYEINDGMVSPELSAPRGEVWGWSDEQRSPVEEGGWRAAPISCARERWGGVGVEGRSSLPVTAGVTQHAASCRGRSDCSTSQLRYYMKAADRQSLEMY